MMRTFGNLALAPDDEPESPEDRIRAWEQQTRIYKALAGPRRWTWEEPMGDSRTSDETQVMGYQSYSEYSRIMSKKTMEDIFPKTVQRLRRFEGLPENWNGYQSVPPTPETIGLSYEVLALLYSEACTQKIRLIEPRVTCGARGDITFAWTIGKKEIELGFQVVTGIPRYEFLLCRISDEDSCDEGSFEGVLRDNPILSSLVSWM
jgi:hypothetical protein